MLASDGCIPKRIIQIVSGSRTGSSLLKTLLAGSPDVTALDGEEEPYFALSDNGYGRNSDSDALDGLDNPGLFRRFIKTELTTKCPWEWRLRLQYQGQRLATLLNYLPSLTLSDPVAWLRDRGVYGHYDGCPRTERIPFAEMVYEMSPYVMATARTKSWDGEVLLLKSPYNLYRPGILSQVFPGVPVSHVYLVRNPAATVNGLIDGWKAPYGFHKHLTPYGWWKFEMPPGWKDYIGQPTAAKAWFQWRESHQRIAELLAQEGSGALLVRFERLITTPKEEVTRICRGLGIRLPGLTNLPLVMATETPTPGRWKRRAGEILQWVDPQDDTVEQLGYGDACRWE